ncbi:MAG: putative serine protease PepD [Actinomycetota bacterium]|nr:putative serine protease PepD [Actinomycetota bacterium]
MTEEQRPPGGPDPQEPEQPTVAVNLESTQPIGGYPPPSGSPFVHQSPPPAAGPPPAEAQPEPQGHLPYVPVGSSAPQGPYAPQGSSAPQVPYAPEGQTLTASPTTGGSKDGRGPRRLGGGAITAIAAGGLVIALVAALFGGMAGAFLVSRDNAGDASLPVAPRGSVIRPKGSIADIAARVLPSVVTIKIEGPAGSGTGSGFVMRKDGYILTNNHVVEAAKSSGTISVQFSDGKSADATIIGRDDSYDLAVIRVNRRNLRPLVLGPSLDVVVGDPVIAVGAPLGLDSTVTSGIVSALNRPVTAGGAGASSASFINAIQTDAAINPGNSGGPLVDMAGEVIGVNSAIARVAGADSGLGGQSGNIGVGFAIPSDQVRKTAEQLIANGKATHPVIGVSIDTSYKGEGVRIASKNQNGSSPIAKGGPADKAGLKPGDVILKFDGRVVTDPDEFVVAIRAKSVGETVALTVKRGGSERTVKMTLQAAS